MVVGVNFLVVHHKFRESVAVEVLISFVDGLQKFIDHKGDAAFRLLDDFLVVGGISRYCHEAECC